jgi:hypothetical protein
MHGGGGDEYVKLLYVSLVCICRSTEVRVEVQFTLCSPQSYRVSTETHLTNVD